MLEDLDQRLNLLEMKCRRPVEHLLAGEYRSIFRGRGIEFEDVREYQPGDDVRTMDWKVTARTGVPHIKRYIEEREQYVYLLVDLSASIRSDVAGRKRKTVAEVGALLTMTAIQNHDRVGLILFTDRIEQVVLPGKGRSHAMRIMDALANFEPEGRGTDFPKMLSRFGQMARKYSIVFLISDFLADGFAPELTALACRHDLNAIHLIEEPFEQSDTDGLVRMEDAETGAQTIVDFTELKESKLRSSLGEEMRDGQIHLLELPTGSDCVEALAGFFNARQRRWVDETGG